MTSSYTFHVYSQSGASINILLLGNDDKTRVYKMDYKSSSIFSKNMDINIIRLASSHKGKGSPGTVVGTIDQKSFSNKLDISVNNVRTVMDENGSFTRGGFFTSTFPGVGVLTWQGEGRFSGGLELVDGKGMRFARYAACSFFSAKKMATLEILMNPMPSQEVVDEIVVTALAVIFELGRKGNSQPKRAIRGISEYADDDSS